MPRVRFSALCLLVICCLTPAQGEEKEDIPCWRGNQCDTCVSTNPGYVGSQNGVKVCCQQCYTTGFTMIGGDVCTCNMPRPTGSASTLTSFTGLLASLVLTFAARALC